MYTPRGRGRGARPRSDQAARLGDDLSRPARRDRRDLLRQWRRRDVERRELRDQVADPRRVGTLVDAVDVGTPRRSQCSATRSLAQIISCSISPWASVCSTAWAGRRRPRSRTRTPARGRDLQRRAAAALTQRCGGAAGEVERLRDQLRRRGAAGEVLVELRRRRGARRSGSGCGRSSPSAARRRRRAGSPPSPRAGRRRGPGCRRRRRAPAAASARRSRARRRCSLGARPPRRASSPAARGRRRRRCGSRAGSRRRRPRPRPRRRSRAR